MRKIYTIIIALALLGLVGFFAWPYIRSNFQSVNTAPPPSENSGSLASAGLTQASHDPIVNYWVSGNSVVSLSLTGEIKKGDDVLSKDAIQDIVWSDASFDQNYITVGFGTSQNPTFSVFDIGKKSWSPLPQGTVAAAWAPTQNELVYVKDTNNISIIYLYDPVSKKSTELSRAYLTGFNVSWIMSDRLYFVTPPTSQTESNFLVFMMKTKTWSTLFAHSSGLMLAWRDDGKMGAKFSNSFKDASLTLTDEKGQFLGNMPFVTLPSKCALGAIIYCAVSQNLPSGTILPDDYLSHKTYTTDTLVAFNTASSTTASLIDSNTALFDAKLLRVSGHALYFVNRYDNLLYSLPLK